MGDLAAGLLEQHAQGLAVEGDVAVVDVDDLRQVPLWGLGHALVGALGPGRDVGRWGVHGGVAGGHFCVVFWRWWESDVYMW